MAIVNWESFYETPQDKSINFFHVEVNDQTNAIRRVHWNVQPGKTLRVQVGEPHNIDTTIIATAVTGPVIGDQNIPGNNRLVENTDDPANPYLEAPWLWSVSWMDNGNG